MRIPLQFPLFRSPRSTSASAPSSLPATTPSPAPSSSSTQPPAYAFTNNNTNNINNGTNAPDLARNASSASNANRIRFSLSTATQRMRSLRRGEFREKRKPQPWYIANFERGRKHLWILLTAMIFEMALIALYLGLVLGMKKHSARGELPKEYHILLMVLIVVASVAVCYALVRVCVVFSRPVEGRKTVEDVESQQQEQQQQQQQQRRRRDMRAAAAAAAIVVEHYQPHVNHQHATPPPVYGSWRHSTHINPTDLQHQHHHQQQYYYPPNTRHIYHTTAPNNNNNTTTTAPLRRNNTTHSAVSALSGNSIRIPHPAVTSRHQLHNPLPPIITNFDGREAALAQLGRRREGR